MPYIVQQARATVDRILDGDTFECTFHIRLFKLAIDLRGQFIRIKDINAAEKEGITLEAGKTAADHLAELILGKEILIVSDGHTSFNRLVAEVFRDYENIGARMVADGFAVAV